MMRKQPLWVENVTITDLKGHRLITSPQWIGKRWVVAGWCPLCNLGFMLTRKYKAMQWRFLSCSCWLCDARQVSVCYSSYDEDPMLGQYPCEACRAKTVVPEPGAHKFNYWPQLVATFGEDFEAKFFELNGAGSDGDTAGESGPDNQTEGRD